MTVEAQRPTGTPGTAPRGPAGPSPEPRGPRPSSPSPGTQKPPPSSPKGQAEVLDTFDLLLRSLQLLDARELRTADPAARMRLTYALDLARRAVADLQNSGRDGKDTVRRSAAVAFRPDQPRAGRPPLPGADTFSLPRPPDFEIGVGPLYDALPRRSR